MYEFLEGRVAGAEANRVVLDVGGVGYLLLVSGTTAGTCARALGSKAGERFRLLTHLVVTDGEPRLFGFATADERELFRLLTSVSGVGPSTAMALLTALATGDLVAAIARGDEGALRAVKGVGAKTASRLVVELRDAIQRVDAGAASSPARRDAVSALVALGFPRHEAERLVETADRSQAEANSEELVKRALAASRTR
jgi:Holliday junction DNA helicase RuvA